MEYFLLFITGTVVGSFLNVLIDRLPKGEQVLTGRSHCDNCGRTLSWRELIPIVSFMLLKGRCQNCLSPIPYRYLVMEFITGLLFVFVYGYNLQTGGSVMKLLTYLMIVSALLAVLVVDLRERIILDEMLMILLLAGAFLVIIDKINHIDNFVGARIFSSLGAGLFFWLIYWLTKGRGMGFGDVKFAAAMGFLLGFPLIIVGLWTAFLSGGILAIILLLTGRKKFGETVAFGPFLVLGTMTALFWGEKFIKFLILNS